MPTPKASGEQVKQPFPSPSPLASQLLSRAVICKRAGRSGGEGWAPNPDEGWPGAGGWRGGGSEGQRRVNRDCTVWSRALTWLSRTAFLSRSVARVSSSSVSFGADSPAAGACAKLLLACQTRGTPHVSQGGDAGERGGARRRARPEGRETGVWVGGIEVGRAPALPLGPAAGLIA